MDKINQLPLDTLVGDTRAVIEDMQAAANALEETSSDVGLVLEDLDTKALNRNLNQVLTDVSTLLKNYSEGGLSQGEIQETVDAMQETLRNLQPLLLQLNQRPSSLLFPNNNGTDRQPKAKSGERE